MNTEQLLTELLSVPGICGAEDDAAKTAEKLLSAYMPVRRDALGSVIGEMQGEGDGILLDAHLDRIGLMVTHVTDEGFVKIGKCGGADLRTMACQEVKILGKREVYGVVVSVPPHLLKGESTVPDWGDIAVDVGMTGEQAKQCIAPGDRVLLLGGMRKMLGSRVCGAAIDDRAGMAAILRALDILKEKNIRKKLTVVFSVQEEVTGGGAIGAAFQSDDATAICVDVSFATQPGVDDVQGKPMGKGTLVGVSSALSFCVSDRLQSLAKDAGIPYTVEVMPGKTGTNAENYGFSKCGRRNGLLSIPIRNMHTCVEVCDLRDIESTAQLLALYVEKEGETV